MRVMTRRKSLKAIRWLASHDLAVFLAVLIVVTGIYGFVALADRVVEGRVQTFDEWGIRSLRRPENAAALIGPRWLEEAARNVTALGGVPILVGVNLAVAGGFVLRRKFNALAFVLAAVVGGLLLMLLLKEYFARPRPQVVPYLCAVDGSSFPSGHSMMSAVVYLTLGVLLASGIALAVQARPAWAGTAIGRTGRDQPGLPGRPLSQRRAGRLDGRFGLGNFLLAAGPKAETPQPRCVGPSCREELLCAPSPENLELRWHVTRLIS